MARRRRSALALCLTTSCLISAVSATASETVTYRYDERGRLVKVSRTGTVNNGTNSCYSYDKADNRTNVATNPASDCLNAPPSFSVGDVQVVEGAALQFVVTKSGSAASALTVNFATSNGTAIAGSDYTATSNTLTFQATEATKTVTVPTTDDGVSESAETFTLTLSNPSGGATLADATAIGTINDNDGAAPSFSITDVSVSEGGSLAFTVTKAGTANGSNSVSFATANGTASSADYTSDAGTVTFAAAETSKSVSIATIDDISVESAETVLVNLSAATGGATISDTQGVGTINDDDVAGGCSAVGFTISDASAFESETLDFNITKSGSTTSSCSLDYVTANWTATAPGDYALQTGTVTFASNETVKTVSILANADQAVEGEEAIYLNLSNATGGSTINDDQAIGTILAPELCFDEGGRPIPCLLAPPPPSEEVQAPIPPEEE